jgi:hypothetical protein
LNSDRVEAATRGSTSDEADQEGVMAADEADLHDDIPGLPPGLGRMVARAAAGDESVMPQLCTLLERHPIVWESVGDLANRAEVALLQYLAGRDLFVHEATRRKMAALRAELAPQGPLESLLGGRLVLAWADVSAAQFESFRLAASAPRDVGLHRVLQARLDGANKRFLAATRSLALIRKLLAQANGRGSAAPKEPAAPQEEAWAAVPEPGLLVPPQRQASRLEAVA